MTMDRRTFILLAGAASSGLVRPRQASARRATQGEGRLRFELDERRRWSLFYYGDGDTVPLIRHAEVVTWVGEQPLTLADLEDSTVGNRRPPGGDAVVVRGRAQGVWVEAEFLVAASARAPQATVTLTLFPDRYLPTVKGVRFFQVAERDVLPGDGSLVALVNGYASQALSQVVAVGTPGAQGAVSHGALGLTRAGRGLALGFDADEPGEAKVNLVGDGLEAVSDWLPSRPLRPDGDSAHLHVAFVPRGDGLDALRTVFAPASPVDEERLASAVAPAGWCSCGALAGGVTEADLVANLEFCAAHFDRRFFRYIQLDGGYEKAAGDWETNDKFPHGHRWLTDQIHAKGFRAGLWVAPFAADARSGLVDAHPDWLLKDARGPVVCDAREAWGGAAYALDGAHPKVQQWLVELARRVVQDWGYDALKVDLLSCATTGVAHYGGLTHAEAYRAGLTAIRTGLGTEAFLLAGGAPLQHAAGLVNGMQIGPDVAADWGDVEAPARAAGLRSFYERSSWLNDPGALVVRPPLALAEAQAWASLVALGGGLTLFSDHLPSLPADRLALLARTLPVAPVAGYPIGTAVLEREVAPAIVVGDDVYDIGGPWRFRTGDDPSYAGRAFDEEAWEPIGVPKRWADAGHPDYRGFAWYRTRFTLPSLAAGSNGHEPQGRAAFLALGKVDAVDETFVNGVRVGGTGDFPPAYRGERRTYRRYAVPPDALNWGGDNVLAVRVYAEGAGGLWSFSRGRPPRAWVAEGAPAWWTVVLANWDDEPHPMSLPLASLGISGAKFAAYDVWRDVPAADVSTTLAATLAPRSALTLALRAAAPHPQVIGTTRHIVQGAVDITTESWDPARRSLKARSTNLDDRAYAVTVAVPKGMRPGACTAGVRCSVRRLGTGHVVLEWPSGGDGRDIEWELAFRSTAGR